VWGKERYVRQASGWGQSLKKGNRNPKKKGKTHPSGAEISRIAYLRSTGVEIQMANETVALGGKGPTEKEGKSQSQKFN